MKWDISLLLLTMPVVIFSILTGCNRNSSVIIDTDEMENILYDYHLADAMAQQAKGGYEENAIPYRQAVLRKYNVSQEEFDTSMVYYMRHTDQLHQIYENISDRMQNEAKRIGADEIGSEVTAMGDSANVWKGKPSMVLIPNQPYNLYSYDMLTDTTFHRGDQIVLSFNSSFIFQDGMRDGIAGLSIVLNNDSVVSRVVHMSSTMPMSLSVGDNDSLGVKRIRGFFLLTKNNDANSSSTTLQLMSLSNIKLLRVHAKVQHQQTIPSSIPAQRPFPMRANATAKDSNRQK